MSPVEVQVINGLLQGLWGQQTWVWHKPSWRAQTKSCVHKDPGERSSDPTRNWPRLARECPGASSRGVDRWRPAAGLGALSVAVHAFWRRSPSSSLPPPVCPLLNNRDWTQPHSSTENWIKVLLRMALLIRTRPSFPVSQSLPSGSFCKPLILLHQRADRLKTTITGN